MGADLYYIEHIGGVMWEDNRRFDFRDSYVRSSILARFGLSWRTDVLPMLTEYPEMPGGPGLLLPDACHRLADMLERAKPVDGQTAREERIADQYRGQLVEFLRRGAVAGGIDADL